MHAVEDVIDRNSATFDNSCRPKILSVWHVLPILEVLACC